MRKLILQRPLCFFDLETTGTSVMQDRIVSISIEKIHPSGERDSYYKLINPETVPITKEVEVIHGISNEMVKNEPFFKDLAGEIFDFFKDCDVAGFNLDMFDIPLLSMEFSRVSIAWPVPGTESIDVGSLYKILNPRTLSAAYKACTGKELEGAHNAKNDNEATIAVLGSLLDNNPEISINPSELSLFCQYGKRKLDIGGKFGIDDQGFYLYNFGKFNGKRVIDNTGYLQWMRTKGDFHPDTLAWANKIYEEIFLPPKDESPF